MNLRPVTRRWDPHDLQTALEMVSRAERRALERAERLRLEAEDVLRSACRQAAETEETIRQEFVGELRDLRRELEAASRRATVAEAELDMLRAAHTELEFRARAAGLDLAATENASAVPPLQAVTAAAKRSGGAPRAELAAIEAEALRRRAQAELDLARAREEAVRLLTAATSEAQDLLRSAVSAIERDTAVAAATREQAERDGEAAAALRNEAAELRAEAARVLDEARRRAGQIAEEATEEARRAAVAVRRQVLEEFLSLRDAMDRTRESFQSFLDSVDPPDALLPPDQTSGPVGGTVPRAEPVGTESPGR